MYRDLNLLLMQLQRTSRPIRHHNSLTGIVSGEVTETQTSASVPGVKDTDQRHPIERTEMRNDEPFENALSPEQTYQFDAFGYLIIPDALTPSQIDRIKSTLRRPAEQWDNATHKSFGPLHLSLIHISEPTRPY